MPYNVQKQSPGVIRVFRMSRCPLFSLTCRINVQKQSPGVSRVFRMSRCPLLSFTCRINEYRAYLLPPRFTRVYATGFCPVGCSCLLCCLCTLCSPCCYTPLIILALIQVFFALFKPFFVRCVLGVTTIVASKWESYVCHVILPGMH
ncbi:hypothetical protein GBAR_LOCUS11750 [Geodia barretti]|uniref:Uncharacterized protein n=1 Tax=Geodia barretti TaxID=519541 RepID=A0AA35S0D8_GEOBA|nr:hypothetical protein GBAR_LOCUS11750 [Geodia barretti]